MNLSWFKSYLSNRTQQVVINDCSSVNGHGCFMRGPTGFYSWTSFLFLLLINDLYPSLKDSPISVYLYADDTTLYSTTSDKTSLETNLQNVLDLVHIWCLENTGGLNRFKTDFSKLALVYISYHCRAWYAFHTIAEWNEYTTRLP